MNIEERLKQYILDRYGSIREFTIQADIPYSTVTDVFKRGIGGSSVKVIFKICKVLNISPDALAEGEIAPKLQADYIVTSGGSEILIEIKEVDDIISDTKKRLENYQDLLIGGKPANKETVSAINHGLDIALEMAKRNIKA